MALPVASFGFTPTGLSLLFKDSSSGVPSSWLWTYKDSTGATIGTDTAQNPTKVFGSAGVYTVILVASNSFGNSIAFSLDIVVSANPTLSLTIAEMVAYDIPAPLSTNTPQFKNLVQKWQLALQPRLPQTIVVTQADVFDESKWPPIANVLISKLVLRDFMLNAATGAISSYGATQQLLNGLQNTNTSTIKVADFDAPLSTVLIPDFTGGDTVTLDGIVINGLTSVSSGALTSWIDVQTFLNGLGFGNFTYFIDGSGNRHIISQGNSNILTALSLTYVINVVSTGYNTNFTATNAQIVPITQTISVVNENSGNLLMGPIKEMTTGPSKTQWYDSSNFWKVMFDDGTNGKGGVFNVFMKEICGLAAQLFIRIPEICPKLAKPPIPMFINSKSGGCCDPRNSIHADKGPFINPWYWDYWACVDAYYPYILSSILVI